MAGKQFQASHRYARISARKVRPLADLVRGKNVVDALSILEYQPQRGAYLLKKVIESGGLTVVQCLSVCDLVLVVWHLSLRNEHLTSELLLEVKTK